MPTPVYVISGFLGSGKTTLINTILDTSPVDKKIMVLVNEFGNISIDRKIIKVDPNNVVDLSGGCICCGLFLELVSSLRFALDTLFADIILIESTGLAVPGEIARQALSPAFEGRIEFGGIITVVDASSILTFRYPVIKKQLKDANVVILNKIDLVDSKTLDHARKMIRSMVLPESRRIETRFCKVGYDEIISQRYNDSRIMEYVRTPPRQYDSTAGFATVSLVRHRPLHRDKLIDLYGRLGNKIIRSKGFILTESGKMELQFSNNVMSLRATRQPIQRTELILILNENDKDLIENELRKVFQEHDNPDSHTNP
ncbi:MAG: GTP-binding protein [Deltaproteobacteria bacterium]|nr:GTP-binding protein [Deltaproteobacteria bacterium]